MKTYHAASMHQLLSSELLQSKESISQVCDRPCPFCQREYERQIDLQQHVAEHLEYTALLSLPNLDSIDGKSEPGQINSDSANRNHAESRADDFDRMEPLVFLENDRAGDIPRITETNKELFRRKLEVESVPFDSMNAVNVETRQAYSSDLAGEWLSRLPIKLGEEGELPSEPRLESSSNLTFASGLVELVRLSNTLIKFCSKIDKKFETDPFQDLFTELRSLPETLKRLIDVAVYLRNILSNWQKTKIYAIRCDCENLITDIDKMTVKYGTSKGETASITGNVTQTEVDGIRFKLMSISSKLSVLNASYVTPARTSYEGLTLCSFPYYLKEGIVESREGLEISGQSGMRSILVNLIALGPSGLDSEGERPAEIETSPSSSPVLFNVTDRAGAVANSTPQKTLHDYQRTSDSNHWLPRVFSQSSQISLTLLKQDSDRSPICFGEHVPNAIATIDGEGYASLAEFRFQNDQFIVRLYDRPSDHSPGIFCRSKDRSGKRKDSLESLVVLTILRRGSFLILISNHLVEGPPELWARIKFPDYEGTFIRGL